MKLQDAFAEASPVKASARWKVPADPEHHIAPRPRDGLWFRLFLASLMLLSATYMAVFLRQPVAPDQVWILNLKGYLLLGVSQSILLWLYRRISDYVEPDLRLRNVKTEAPTEHAVGIKIEVLQDGTLTGQDEGYAWIEDGTFFYKGLQTSFRLNADDLPSLDGWPRRLRPRPTINPEPVWLVVQIESRRVCIRLTVLDAVRDYKTRRRSLVFLGELYDWVRERPSGSLETMLFPLTPHPALQRRRFFHHEPFVLAVYCVGLNIALAIAMTTGYETVETQAALGTLGYAFHGLLAVAAVRTSLKLERDDRIRQRASTVTF